LALAWNFLQFPDFLGWPTITTNGKTQKLSSKHAKKVRKLKKNQRELVWGELVKAK
jgi:hypothetical protein